MSAHRRSSSGIRGFDALLLGIAIDLEAEAVGPGLVFPSVPCRQRSRTGGSTQRPKTDGVPVTI
jgi:hypothetical protein